MHSMHWRRWSTSRAESAETEGCGKRASVGVAGTKTVEYCAQYALEGMVDVKKRKCRTAGCGKFPSFGVARTKTARRSQQNFRTEGCGKLASFGVAGSKTRKYCAQHALVLWSYSLPVDSLTAVCVSRRRPGEGWM